MKLPSLAVVAIMGSALVACSASSDTDPSDPRENPFLAEFTEEGKADTGYLNPDGIEIEVDLEADIEAPKSRVMEAPAFLGQFATTYLRKHGDFYLESLAEDSTSADRVEWRVDGQWMTAAKAEKVDSTKLTHFRIRGVNAVLLNRARSGVQQGSKFEATVPLNPFNVMSKADKTCADYDHHIALDQSVYWYLWNPEKSACALPTQKLTLTVSKMFATTKTTYPEYDRLVADGKVTAVVLFGQIDDGPVKKTDPGMVALGRMAKWLREGGFSEVTPAPIGRRFSKHIGSVDFVVDLYSPFDFAGLDDDAHFGNFQKALSEHEIVTYDGHSMLGASDFFERPNYSSDYQIFLYGGCLGYEYYVRPILNGKGGWQNLDMLSSVVEVSATAEEFAAPVLARIAWSLNRKNKSSWLSILRAVRREVGDSTFGMSGVRDNCWSPTGSLCQ